MELYDSYRENAPGVILGPYEGLIAIIAWLREALPQSRYVQMGGGPIRKLLVSGGVKVQLLSAYMLYGRFDVFAAMGFVDSYLASRGFQESRRELVGDFLFSLEKSSPFSHSLETGFSWPVLQTSPRLDSVDEARLVHSRSKALIRAGVRSYTPWEPEAMSLSVRDRVREAMTTIKYCNDNRLMPAPLQAESSILSLMHAIDRLVDLEIPFLSEDAAAPAWVRKDIQLKAAS